MPFSLNLAQQTRAAADFATGFLNYLPRSLANFGRSDLKTAGLAVGVFLGAYCIVRLADIGLSNFLGQLTIRHGTNPLSWLGIHLMGAQPAAGGSAIGGDAGTGWDNQNRGRFYVMLPSDYAHRGWIDANRNSYAVPLTYAGRSCLNLAKRLTGPLNDTTQRVISRIGSVLLPTIRIRMGDDELKQGLRQGHWKLDATHYEEAASTTHWIPPLRIGAIGTLWTGLTYKTPIRMVQNPKRVLLGAAQLLVGAGVAYAAWQINPSWILSHKTALIAGSILAAI